MGQESSRGLKRLAQGVQKVPKGFQKVAKSHEKDIHKASTRHPNAIRKCIGNSVGNSLSNAIANAIATAIGNRRPLRSMKTNTRTGWLGGTDNSSRSDFFLEINLLLYTKYYTRCQARWREGRRQVDIYLSLSLYIYILYEPASALPRNTQIPTVRPTLQGPRNPLRIWMDYQQ